MPNLARVAIGWLSLLGSVLGLLFMPPSLAQSGQLPFPAALFTFITFVIYAYGFWSGLQVIRSKPGWQKKSMWFWLSQAPLGVVGAAEALCA